MAKTGYKIIIYIDVNPQSPTFQTERTERVSSEECSSSSANWAVISEYCETDENGLNTGYLVSREMDISEGSSTYGEIRETKEIDYENCEVQGSDPEWYEDEEQSYCETKIYEPSHLEGYTGYKMKLMIDGNKYSPTHNQQKWVKELSTDCPAPNTEPQIEAISENCVLVECSGKTTTNGYKTVYGIDKNPYSSTYLSSVSETVADEEHCPNNCGSQPPTAHTYVFTFQDGTTNKSDNVQYGSEQKSYTIISTIDGNPCDFTIDKSCDWISTTKESTSFNVNISENTGTSRSCTITLTQNGSNNTIQLVINQAKVVPTFCDFGALEDVNFFSWNDGYYNAEKTYEFASNCNWTISKPSGLDGWLDLKVKPMGGEYSTTLTGTDSTTYVLYMKPKLTSEPSAVYTHTVTASCSCGSETKEIELTVGAQLIGVYNNKIDNFKISHVSFHFTDGTTYLLPLSASGKGDYWTNVYKYWDASMLGKVVERAYGVYNGVEKYLLDLQYGETLSNGGMMGMNTKVSLDNEFRFEETDDDTITQTFNASGFSEIHAFIYSNISGEMSDFTYSSDASWFQVLNVEKKTANKYYDVSTRVLENTSSNERVGKITFTQTGTDNKLYIIATQRGSCTPSTNICYSSYDNVTAPDVSGGQTANTITWSWEGTKTAIDANCQETVTPTSGTSSTTVTFSENYDEERTISGTIDWNVSRCDGGTQSFTIPYSFKQSVICHPSTSTCYSVYDVVANDVDNWKTSANTITWNYSATTTTVNEDCSSLIETVTGSSSATVSFPRNYSIEDVIVSGDVIWNDHIDCSTDDTVKIPYSFNHTRYTGDTSGEIAWYDSSTQTLKTDTTWSSINACPQGGTTSVWIWSNVENAWDDYEITINYIGGTSGWISYARFTTKYPNRAKVDIYWGSNCSGTSNRAAEITFKTPASQTVLVYRVIQRYTRY